MRSITVDMILRPQEMLSRTAETLAQREAELDAARAGAAELAAAAEQAAAALARRDSELAEAAAEAERLRVDLDAASEALANAERELDAAKAEVRCMWQSDFLSGLLK